MPIRHEVITSLGELIDLTTPAQPDPTTGRFRDTGVYRGVFNAERTLLTSLDRLGGIEPAHTKAKLEEHILRNFIRYSRPHLPSVPTSEWEFLVLAQHHGVPTRLLDWTYSPLVAAHFATQPNEHTGDRAIWRLDWQQVHEHFELPSLALLIDDLCALMGDDREETEDFTPWRLFDRDPYARPFACLLEPPSLDARLVAQSAAFTLCSDRTRSFDEFLERNDLASALMILVIPEAAVPRFRDQLDMVSVDERRLFPDLDGVAAAIRRYYS